MSATEIANRHLESALTEAKTHHLDPDAMCRALLGAVVSKYLQTRCVFDVQSELSFIAENCDPETDHAFMRP